ncbi:hypothetical protein, partial [Parabacteroides distasonis]|uniref:hypothetical protein n=1 Tax=Parabacteroides distasonis TaxID=823 RepID=UPI001E4EE972
LNRNLLLSRAINLRSFPINYTLFVTSNGKTTILEAFFQTGTLKIGYFSGYSFKSPIFAVTD